MTSKTPDTQRLWENVKVKIDEYVEKVPMADEQITKVAKKFNTDKAVIVLGFFGVIFLGMLFMGSGDFAV
jgi:hypothetical protein